VVVMITLGYASMVHFPFFGFESESKSTSDPKSFFSANNDFLEWHSSILFQGILWNLCHFLVSFFKFPLPFFVGGLDWLS
jgi:hypothetical protein